MKTFRLLGFKLVLAWRGLEMSKQKMWDSYRVIMLRWWKPGFRIWRSGEVSTSRTPVDLDIPPLYIDGWHEIGED